MSGPDFEANGDLSDSTFAALRELDGSTLGAAIAHLLARAATLEPPQRTIALAALERVIAAGTADASRIRFDVPQLIETYRSVMADPSRRDVADVAVRLLGTVERSTVMDAIPIDASGLDLRVALARELDAVAGMRSAGRARDRGVRPVGSGPSRSIDFGRGDWSAAERTPAMAPQPMPAGAGRPDFEPEPIPQMAEPPPDMAAPDDAAYESANGGGSSGYESANGGGATANGGGATTNGHEPPAPAPTYRAYGVLDCNELVAVGQPFPLEVGLGEKPSPGVSGSAMRVRQPNLNSYKLDVQLFADGFDLAQGESWRQAIEVSSLDLYPTVVLHLIPRDMPDEMADREISATFSIEGETLGMAKRSIRVTKDEADVAVGGLRLVRHPARTSRRRRVSPRRTSRS